MSLYSEPYTLHTLGFEPSRLIGLSGFAQVGKDAVAEILKDHGFKRVAFADPIREAMYILDPIVRSDTYGRTFSLREVIDDLGWDEAKTTVPEVRRLLQVFGTEVGRQLFGESVWTDMAMRKIGPTGQYVITDVRFPDEVHAIRVRGGSLIKIIRPGYIPVNKHVSDAGLPSNLFDGVIFNDGTLEDLRAQVVAAVL